MAIETGEGNGALTLADLNIDFITPENMAEIDGFLDPSCPLFRDKDSIILDSASALSKSFVQKRALLIPRAQGSSEKRKLGIPEMDDYGTMGSLTRTVFEKLLSMDKNILVTAGLREKMPNMETGKGVHAIGPDLPGEMFWTSTAMFDFVFRLDVRRLKQKDGTWKTERFLVTQTDGVTIAKGRPTRNSQPILAAEELIDLETGVGTIPYLIEKIKGGISRI